MIKINLFFDQNLKSIKLPAILKIPHKRISSDFVLDTGSPHTILNYSDSIRLGIPHTAKGEIIRIGGKIYQSYIFNKFEILLKATNNQIVTEIIPIRILKPHNLKINEIEELDNFPNLLGLDFLEKGYNLFCDINSNKIYFEKENFSNIN